MPKMYLNSDLQRTIVVYEQASIEEEFLVEIQPGRNYTYDGSKALVFTDSKTGVKLHAVLVDGQPNSYELLWPDIRTDGMVDGGP